MTTRLSRPLTKQQGEKPLFEEKRLFAKVLMEGPRSQIPSNALKYLKNCQIQDNGDVRGKMGSKRYGTATMPEYEFEGYDTTGYDFYKIICASKSIVNGNNVVDITGSSKSIYEIKDDFDSQSALYTWGLSPVVIENGILKNNAVQSGSIFGFAVNQGYIFEQWHYTIGRTTTIQWKSRINIFGNQRDTGAYVAINNDSHVFGLLGNRTNPSLPYYPSVIYAYGSSPKYLDNLINVSLGEWVEFKLVFTSVGFKYYFRICGDIAWILGYTYTGQVSLDSVSFYFQIPNISSEAELDYFYITRDNLITINSDWIGKYFVWQDANGNDIYHDLIIGISAVNPTTQFYVLDSTARLSTETGWLREPQMATPVWQPVRRVMIEVIGDKVYTVDESYTTRTLIPYAGTYSLDGSYSEIKIIEKNAIIFNGYGIFKVDFDQNKVFQLNVPIINERVETVAKTEDDVYGYRYWITQLCLDISDASLSYHDRNNSKILHESAPWPGELQTSGMNAGKIVDYGERWGELPVGDPTVNYGKLEGASLESPYDVVSGWTSIARPQIKIAMGSGTAQNIEFDFTNCTTMFDVALEIQTRMRAYWPSVNVNYVNGHFEVINPEDNATLNYAMLPDAGGTDVSAKLGLSEGYGYGLYGVSSSIYGEVAAAILNPQKYSSRTINLAVDPDTAELQHFNYFGIYRSKDVGVNGTDPLIGVGNNPEKGIWVADLAVDSFPYTDITSDDNLRITEFQKVLPNRSFVPLPNLNTGTVANGFLVGGIVAETEIDYCQIKYLADYQMGYHYNGEDGQYDTINDSVQRVTSFPDCVIVYGSRSIWRLMTNQPNTDELTDLGISIGFMSQAQKMADWGILDRYSVNEATIKSKRYDIVKANDGELILFDGYNFSKNYAQDLSTLMKQLQNVSASSYSRMGGFRYFGTTKALNTSGGYY